MLQLIRSPLSGGTPQTKPIEIGDTLYIQTPNSLRLDSNSTYVLSEIREPSEHNTQGLVICNLSEQGVKSWQAFFPSVFGLTFQEVSA